MRRTIFHFSAATVTIAVIGIAFIGLFAARHRISDAYRRWKQGPVPQTVSREQIKGIVAAGQTDDGPIDWSRVNPNEGLTAPQAPSAAQPAAPDSEAVHHPDETKNPPILNLYVPFAVQSPSGQWTDVDEEACEEASMIMVKGYYADTLSFTADQVKSRIDDIVAYENKTLGFFEDTTAEQTASVMRDFLGLPAKVVAISSIDDIKARIAKGDPVILPAFGQALGNPYFSGDGPLYHMVVAKGYTAKSIIVNDPGTKRGEDYLYDDAVLWNAIGDWNDGDPANGAKVMIVVDKNAGQ